MNTAAESKYNPVYLLFLFGPSFAAVVALFTLLYTSQGAENFFALNGPRAFWAFVLVDIVFMHSTHIAYTFAMYAFLPEMRVLRKEMRERDGEDLDRSFLWMLAALTVFFVVLLFMLQKVETPWIRQLVLFPVLMIVPRFHGFAQIFGFLCVVSQNTPGARMPPRWQKQGIYFVFWWSTSLLFLRPYFRENDLMRTVGTWAAVIPISAIVVAIFVHEIRKAAPWQKNIFLLRILIWPINSLFSAVGSVVSANHGVEYIYAYRRMKANSDIDVDAHARMKRAARGMILLYAAISIGAYYCMTNLPAASWWLVILATAKLALAFLHYYMDYRLFRMKDPLCRKHVAPLLNKGFIPN